jgi:nucleoid-associated protein
MTKMTTKRTDETQVVLHRLTKVRNEKPEMKLGSRLLKLDEPTKKLVENVRYLYTTKQSVSTGAFDLVVPGMRQGLGEFQDGTKSFITMTQQAMHSLSLQMAGANLATSGYVLFAVYKYNERSYFMCTILRNVVGVAISDTLDVTKNIHIDLEKLHMGARVDLTAWRAKEKSYLTFINGKAGADEVSDYFLRFVGCTQVCSASENARRIAKFVDDYLAHSGWDQSKIEQRRADCFQYCFGIAKTKMPFRVTVLARVLDPDDPESVVSAAGADAANLNDGGTLAKAPLRAMLWIQASDDDVAVRFKRRLLGDSVSYDQKQRTLTISSIGDKLHTALVEATSDGDANHDD